MASNPNPARISAACWWFWGQFDVFEPTVVLGGVYASKPGYHNYRNALPGYDYSVGQVSTDRADSGQYAAAIDLTMSDAAMKKYSARLHNACANRDPRLFIGGQAILREYIGTLDGHTVSCYVVLGGRALGLAGDSGPDYDRDETHLWHIHLSVIRKFVDSYEAWKRLLSILKGETAAQYFAPPPPSKEIMSMELNTVLGGETGLATRNVGDTLRDLQNLRGYLIGETYKAAQLPSGAPARQLEQIGVIASTVKNIETQLVAIATGVKTVQDAVANFKPSTPAPVDPSVIQAALAAALTDPRVVAGLVKAVNDDAARRAAE